MTNKDEIEMKIDQKKDNQLSLAADLDAALTKLVIAADDQGLRPNVLIGVISRNISEYGCQKSGGNGPLVARTILRAVSHRLSRYVPDERNLETNSRVVIEMRWDPDGMGNVETHDLLMNTADFLDAFLEIHEAEELGPNSDTCH